MFEQTTLVGRVGHDPEIKEFDDGRKLAKLSMVTTRRWKASGVPKKKDTWHDVTFWGGVVPAIKEYVHKGSVIMVVGHIVKGEYENKSGHKVKTFTIEGETITFLPSGSGRDEERSSRYDDDDYADDGPSQDDFNF